MDYQKNKKKIVHLNRNELKEVNGGEENNNTIRGCVCKYKDSTSISYNTNTISDCACACV